LVPETSGGPDDPEVPTGEPVLDDAFIAGATVREPSAQERERQARIDAEHRRLIDEARLEQGRQIHLAHRAERKARRRPRHLRSWLAVVIVGALTAVAIWSARTPRARRESLAFGADQVAMTAAQSQGELPPPGVGEQAKPLGKPAPAPTGTGAYKLLATQPGKSAPVAYDPCRELHVVINDRTEPPGGDDLVRAALTRAAQVSGLDIVVDGTSSEAPSYPRHPYLPSLYPKVWAPTLIAWTDPTETPRLAGEVAGVGGSAAMRIEGSVVYVSGEITLDGPQLSQILAEPGGPAQVQAVIEHEVGHVLGLAHVNDPGQLMYPTGGRVTDYASGDQVGLEALGRGRCFPDV
jgi:hypothetical protein